MALKLTFDGLFLIVEEVDLLGEHFIGVENECRDGTLTERKRRKDILGNIVAFKKGQTAVSGSARYKTQNR